MGCPNCPVCNTELEFKNLDIQMSRTIRHFNCPTCKIAYHEYCPQGGKNKWYAHIALGTFPKSAWETFLFTEWNYYGDPMPEGPTCKEYGPSEQVKKEAEEWHRLHPKEE